MKRISPNRIVEAVKENFKGILSKPSLKNLILVTIAIALAEKLKINQIARHLPADVKHQKAKQTRLLRMLKRRYPLLDMMFSWTKFVLQRVYGRNNDVVCMRIIYFGQRIKQSIGNVINTSFVERMNLTLCHLIVNK